jgi:hypothetical protein
VATPTPDPAPAAVAAKRRRRRRQPTVNVSTAPKPKPKPAARPKPPTATPTGGFAYNPAVDPSQPPPFRPFTADYSKQETNAARKLANARIDSLLAALPTTQSIRDRYGAQSVAAGQMAQQLADALRGSLVAQTSAAGGAPNLFTQTVASAGAPAAQTAAALGAPVQAPAAGAGLMAAMSANTINSMAGAPGAAMARGTVTQGAIARNENAELKERQQDATAIRLKLPELQDLLLTQQWDRAKDAWGMNENSWIARSQMAQQSNQFNAGQANDAAQQAAGTAQIEKLRGQRTDGADAKPWRYRVERPGQYEGDPPVISFEEMDEPISGALPAGWTLDRPGAAATGASSMPVAQLYQRGVAGLVARGIGRKRAQQVMQRYLNYNPSVGTGPHGR